MKRIFYLNIFVFFSLLAPHSGPYVSGGCFSVVVGRKASSDGSVLFGHNEDNGPDFPAALLLVPRRYHPAGTYLTLPGGGRIEQAPVTLSYLCLRMPHGPNSDVLLNEKGVAIASNQCPSREEEGELSEGGISGPILRHLVAQRARTAREGVLLVGRLVERFGYTASGRTLVIVDSREGWLVALVRGKHWVAQRVPDTGVAVLANSYTIGRVYLKESEKSKDTAVFFGSKDLIEYAEKRSWYDPAGGPFSFEAAYADPQARENPSNTQRAWSALRLLSRRDFANPPPPYPFAIKPERPLSFRDVARILRDHYERLSFRKGDPHACRPIPICRSVTNSSSIFHLRSDLPPALGCVWYLALWQPCSTPYMPLFAGLSEAPPSLGFGPKRTGGLPGFGEAYSLFARAARWVREDYPARSVLVRTRSKRFEEVALRNVELLQNCLQRRFSEGDRSLRELLTRYSTGAVRRAIHRWRVLLGEARDGGSKACRIFGR